MSLETPWPDKISATSSGLAVIWQDQLAAELTWNLLRKRCPCATCKAEREKPPASPTGLLPVLSLQEAQPLKAVQVVPVGNYAYGIHFNDGHASGIFSLKFLRELSEELNAKAATAGR